MARQDEGHIILMLLRKNGPMTIEQLKGHFFKFASQFGFGFEQSHHHHQSHGGKGDFFQELNTQIEILAYKGLIENQDGQLSLTQAGLNEGEQTEKQFQKAAGWVNKNLLSAEGATKNTLIIDAILAFFKLLTGFITSSVGLIADGTDAALDTLTAGVVFWSVKKKKEMIGSFVIIAMMSVTAVGLGVDSVSSIFATLRGESENIVRPGLVISIEGVALVFAYLLSLYQRFVGKKTRSLALISQSVDSKNHIFVAGAVIAGAIFSVFGIHYIDAAIGVYIAVKIFIDSIGLLRETFNSMQGQEIDFDKFSGHIDNRWKSEKNKAFMATILYSLLKNKHMSEKELITILEDTFQPGYIPVLSEFQIGFAFNTDFEQILPEMMAPLIDQSIVKQDERGYWIDEKKRIEIEEFVSNTFVVETKPQDLKKRLINLYHNDFDAIDGIERIGDYLDENETISAITRGKTDQTVCVLLTTQDRIHIFSRRAKNHESIAYEEILAFTQTTGRLSTLTIDLTTSSRHYSFSYLSQRKSFGFINELKRHLAALQTNDSNQSLLETEDEFTKKIKILHRIQRYLGKRTLLNNR